MITTVFTSCLCQRGENRACRRAYFFFFSFFQHSHSLPCACVSSCRWLLLWGFGWGGWGGGGGGVITSWKCELCLRRWVLKMFHVRRSTLFYWCVQCFMSVFINVHPDLFHVFACHLVDGCFSGVLGGGGGVGVGGV